MTDKEQYEEALRVLLEAEVFLNLNRCFDCDNLDKINGNVCVFNGSVPDDYLHSPNECEQFHYLVPF